MPQGYNLVVGGGLGRTHRNEDTFPRIADPLGFVDKDDLFHAVREVGCRVASWFGPSPRPLPELQIIMSHHVGNLPCTLSVIAAQVKAVVATQRDYGRRDDRRQSRLKYLVHEWGVDRFRCVG